MAKEISFGISGTTLIVGLIIAILASTAHACMHALVFYVIGIM